MLSARDRSAHEKDDQGNVFVVSPSVRVSVLGVSRAPGLGPVSTWGSTIKCAPVGVVLGFSDIRSLRRITY